MNLKKKLERYLRVNLLGRGPRLIKKNLPDRGLTKVEKHCFKRFNGNTNSLTEQQSSICIPGTYMETGQLTWYSGSSRGGRSGDRISV